MIHTEKLRIQPTECPDCGVSPGSWPTKRQGDALIDFVGDVSVLDSKFTLADAQRLTVESAGWPLPVVEKDAARKAIEANGFRCDEPWRNPVVKGTST